MLPRTGDREEYRCRAVPIAEHTHDGEDASLLQSDIVDGENAVAQRPQRPINNQPSTAAKVDRLGQRVIAQAFPSCHESTRC